MFSAQCHGTSVFLVDGDSTGNNYTQAKVTCDKHNATLPRTPNITMSSSIKCLSNILQPLAKRHASNLHFWLDVCSVDKCSIWEIEKSDHSRSRFIPNFTPSNTTGFFFVACELGKSSNNAAQSIFEISSEKLD